MMNTIIVNGFIVEDMSQTVSIHTTPRIVDREFDVCFMLCSTNDDLPSFVRKLAGIVGKGIKHEQCQHTISLDNSLGGFYNQRNTFHVKTGTTSVDKFKKRLQGETLNVKAQLTLT